MRNTSFTDRAIIIYPKQLEALKLGWDPKADAFTDKPVDGVAVKSWDTNPTDVTLTYFRPGSLFDENQSLLIGEGDTAYEWDPRGELISIDRELFGHFTPHMPPPIQEAFLKLESWAGRRNNPTVNDVFAYLRQNDWLPAVYTPDLKAYPGLEGRMESRQHITLVTWEDLEKAGWLPETPGPEMA